MIRAGHMLSWPAQRYPDRIAVTYEGQHMTFCEVNARVNRLAHGLIALGLQRGDRVAALLYNSPRAIEVRFALMKAGLCMVALNVRQSEAEHAYIINHSESRVLILDADYLSIWERIRTTCAGVQQAIVATPEPTRYLAYDDLIAGSPEHEPEVGEVRIVNAQGQEAAAEEAGELWVRGDTWSWLGTGKMRRPLKRSSTQTDGCIRGMWPCGTRLGTSISWTAKRTC
jgi:non-ribosomal peptide synthetase component E (peptide arylation enzyme)